mgnify:FL=1
MPMVCVHVVPRSSMVEINARYRHFKGKEYQVVGIAKDSETLQEMVVYRQLYGDGGFWVRPLAMFEENVTRDGKTFPRFELIEE